MTVRRGHPEDYRVAVLSYQRADVLSRKTLPTLLGGGVDPKRITVWARDDDPQLPEYRVLCLSAGVDLRATGARGIRAARREAFAWYQPGTALVQLDDDVRRITQVRDGKLHTLTDVHGWLAMMFRETAARDLWLWGVAPVPNAFFLREGQLTEGLKFCIATLWGAFTRPGHPVHDARAEVKEDYETTLRAWWYDGAVLRADDVAPQADHYTPGGCTDTRSVEVEEAAVQVLEQDWPGLVRRNTKRKGPYPEVVLARKGRGTRRPADCPLPGGA